MRVRNRVWGGCPAGRVAAPDPHAATFEPGRNTCPESARTCCGARRAGGSNAPRRACHSIQDPPDGRSPCRPGYGNAGLRMPRHTPHGRRGTSRPIPGVTCRLTYVRACASRGTRRHAAAFHRHLSGFACHGIQDAHAGRNDDPGSHTHHHRTHIPVYNPNNPVCESDDCESAKDLMHTVSSRARAGKKNKTPGEPGVDGVDNAARTRDLLNHNQMLYRLSYIHHVVSNRGEPRFAQQSKTIHDVQDVRFPARRFSCNHRNTRHRPWELPACRSRLGTPCCKVLACDAHSQHLRRKHPSKRHCNAPHRPAVSSPNAPHLFPPPSMTRPAERRANTTPHHHEPPRRSGTTVAKQHRIRDATRPRSRMTPQAGQEECNVLDPA